MAVERAPAGMPVRFFGLVLLLTIPFSVLGWLSAAQILPGVPLGGLAVICPTLAAVVCVHRERRGAGVRALLARSVDARRIARPVWYLPVLLLYPAVVLTSCLFLRLRGADIPAPEVGAGVLVLAVVFLIGAAAEELGWSGYALEALLQRRSALTAGLLLGSFWAVWHWIPLLQVGRSPAWIAWWTLGTVAARVIMVWLFVNTGRSVFATVLFHAVVNLSWQLFPVDGSYFDQPSVAVLMAVTAITVTAWWGPRTLAGRSVPAVRLS